MKIDMSPKAIENRLKLVGELTKACLLLRQNSLKEKQNLGNSKEKIENEKKNEKK